MARLFEHQKALALRKRGKSYSQIKQLLGISKSTLSEWLKSYPLTRDDLNRLCYKNEIKIEKYRQTMQNKHNKRLEDVYASQKNNISSLTDREIFIAGIFLY
jgi:predicted transcriptional regulator